MAVLVVGRKRKIGNELCPNCGNTGYRRKKQIRNRPGGRYIPYWYFRHNDRRIRKECYIDKFIEHNDRPVRKDKNKNRERTESEDLNVIVHDIKKKWYKITRYPLDRQDIKWVAASVSWFEKNILALWYCKTAVDQGRVKITAQDYNRLLYLIDRNTASKRNIFGRGYKRIYDKYERPEMLAKIKLRNEKLKQWPLKPRLESEEQQQQRQQVRTRTSPGL
jgi:hypothetical protein